MNAVEMRETHLVTSSETGRVLIADDQMDVLDALQMLLSGCGLATEAVTHPGCVLRALKTGQFDAVLMQDGDIPLQSVANVQQFLTAGSPYRRSKLRGARPAIYKTLQRKTSS